MKDCAGFVEMLRNNPVIPVVVVNGVEEAVLLADCLWDNGCRIIEITLRTEAGLPALAAIKKRHPAMVVGAGTVRRVESFRDAEQAGADFVVSPGCAPGLLEYGAKSGGGCVPGVMTASEILTAAEYGFPVLKFFPASLAGGITAIKTYDSVFPDVLFCPTGGINGENFVDFLRLDNVVALGGTWIATREEIDIRQFGAIAAKWQSLAKILAEM
ncbi:MAG: bifunctional 4-hydroxy-2-oxoglutarate aldolase/2-dehydro-3-deoxy-phosphogluconate aldolase [Negativicutes bacterium]|nr:bifunctional 4-hydroxy-2-oxoglutarate aldolase/2-dehydro-3-deoxy-phosphogluconate aldolase [Negativicutes bacterium]